MSTLYFRYGAMKCGKSTALLQVAYNAEENGKKVILIKPAVDTKGEDRVVSRLGVERKVDILLGPNDNVPRYNEADKPYCILVDEAQFLSGKQVMQLYILAKLENIPVMCYGLRSDFQMNGFPASLKLLTIADELEELRTICSCGKKATLNLREVNGEAVFEGDQISIDNQDSVKYKPSCGTCYVKQKRYKA